MFWNLSNIAVSFSDGKRRFFYMENEKKCKNNDLGSTGVSNSRPRSQKRGISGKIKVSFDMITVVGALIPERENKIKKHIENSPEINLWDTGFDRFKCNVFDNKVYISYNRKEAQAMGKSEIRVEFNPNELSENEKQFIQFVFLDNMRNKDFSRIDLAFDVEEDLADYYSMSDRRMKQTHFYGIDGKVETKYFGVRESDRYIRIYNKKKQLSEVKEQEISADHLWRVEFELKRSRTKTWDKCFDDIHILQPEWTTVEKDNTRAMVYMLIHEQGEWGKLTKNTKTKYRKIIKEISEVNISDDLRKVLSEQHQRLSEELENYIAISHHDKMFDFDFGH